MHHPTENTRLTVRRLASGLLPHDLIGVELGISAKTLRRHYPIELKQSRARRLNYILESVLDQAEHGNLKAAMYILEKTQTLDPRRNQPRQKTLEETFGNRRPDPPQEWEDDDDDDDDDEDSPPEDRSSDTPEPVSPPAQITPDVRQRALDPEEHRRPTAPERTNEEASGDADRERPPQLQPPIDGGRVVPRQRTYDDRGNLLRRGANGPGRFEKG